MPYYHSKTVNLPFDEAVERVTETLKEEGFGILSDIDVQATLKKKLDVDVPAYRILGACNPPFAYQALQAEDKIGTMLPCNVIVQERGPTETEISAVDPVASMQAVENPDLEPIAGQVREKLMRAVDAVA
ncbi:MAG: DUF302 domain-containing protein [Gemmatimonadota bacterium]